MTFNDKCEELCEKFGLSREDLGLVALHWLGLVDVNYIFRAWADERTQEEIEKIVNPHTDPWLCPACHKRGEPQETVESCSFRVLCTNARCEYEDYWDVPFSEADHDEKGMGLDASSKALPTCQRCGSDLDLSGSALCVDSTCPFSHYKQSDERGWEGHPDAEAMMAKAEHDKDSKEDR